MASSPATIALCSLFLLVALCSADSSNDTISDITSDISSDISKVDPSVTKEIIAAEIASIKAVPSTNPNVQRAIDQVVQMMEKDMNENKLGKIFNIYNFLYNSTGPNALSPSEVSQVETIILNASKEADKAKNISVPVTDADAEGV